MKERIQSYAPEGLDTERDFAIWEQELERGAEATQEDLAMRERELQPDAETLERQVLESPEEPQINWVESNANGTVSEEQYRQQSYWVIGQFGHAMDVARASITTDEQAKEWLEMKMSIAAAKSVVDAYELATIRAEMIPIWEAYVKSRDMDWEAYERVCNR